MTYTSLNFIFFVLATSLVYFVLPFKKYRWTVLLAASIFFYCTWSYQLGAFMLFTTLSTYLIALWLSKASAKSKAVLKAHKSEWSRDDKKKYKNKTKVRMRLIMTLALLLNFGILAFLKYYNFFAENLSRLPLIEIPRIEALKLPIGISFYTFQIISYTVDLYRRDCELQRNYITFGTYVTLFPQLDGGYDNVLSINFAAAEMGHKVAIVEGFADNLGRVQKLSRNSLGVSVGFIGEQSITEFVPAHIHISVEFASVTAVVGKDCSAKHHELQMVAVRREAVFGIGGNSKTALLTFEGYPFAAGELVAIHRPFHKSKGNFSYGGGIFGSGVKAEFQHFVTVIEIYGGLYFNAVAVLIHYIVADDF